MAYLGNGIYDLTDVIKASANPQINYEGLYQDAPSNIATSNLFKAMQPGFEYRSPSFIDNAMRTGGYDLAGNVPVDFNRRRDFRNYFDNKPLRPTDGVIRFENFNPRVGTITPFQPYESPAFLAKQNVNPYFQGIMNQAPIDLGIFEGITEETDIDDDTQDKIEETKTGIETLLGFLQNIPTPMNLIRGGLQGLQNFNQRLRGTDFGRSKTLADYFDAKSYGGFDAREKARAETMAQARGIQKSIDRGDFGGPNISIDRGRGDIGGGSKPSGGSRSSGKSRSSGGYGGGRERGRGDFF